MNNKKLNMDAALVEVIEHFGVKHQEEKAIEEMAELSKELVKKWHCTEREEGIRIVKNIREEVADVYVMIRQLMLMCNKELVEEIAAQKVSRTLEVIDSERSNTDR